MAERDLNVRLRKDVVSALRRGVVPEGGLALIATGMDRYARVVDDELDDAAAGRGVLKAVRGEWGEGKTFFSRWLGARAIERGFAATEVQVSDGDTPLYRPEAVYRRAVERLSTRSLSRGAFRSVVDGWLYAIEDELRKAREIAENASPEAIAGAVEGALERRLRAVSQVNATFSSILRAYHRAVFEQDEARAEGLIAWLSGQPNVAASVKRSAGVKGDLDGATALAFLRGLLHVLRESGHKGLLLVLDEVETIQRQPRNMRAKSLQALRALVDELETGAFPGLYVLVTGTPAFYDGREGVQLLPPLHQRLQVTFGADARQDNLRLPQIRLVAFDRARLLEVGGRVRDLYPAERPDDLRRRVTDAFLERLADAVAGALGGSVGIAPRLYLRKLVDVLDRVNDQPEFDPASEFALDVRREELTVEERAKAGVELAPGELARAGDAAPQSPDDIVLEDLG